MEYDDRDLGIGGTEPLLLAQPDNKADGKILIFKKNMNKILRQVPDNLPLSVISVVGPPSTGKFLLLDHLVRYLTADDNEHDSSCDGNPDGRLQWSRDGKSQETPGIWCYPSPFFAQMTGDMRRSIAVLLLYTQTSITWDSENADVCALMGLTLSLSSHTVFNVYKHLDEQCLSAVGSYIKYAIHGQARSLPSSPLKNRGRSQLTPLQNATFLIRDWNFPSEFPFGVNGGVTFVNHEKLKEKPEHSKDSRESRLLIKNLFENISGCLLPFPGTGVIQEDFQGSTNEMEPKFAINLDHFISHVVNFDESNIKRDGRGETVTGSIFREIMEDFSKAINEMEGGSFDTQGIFRRYRIFSKPNLGEQKEVIKVGLQVYADFWKRYEKSNEFLEERALQDIHSKAKIKAITAFENAVCSNNEDDDDEQDNSDDDDDNDADLRPKVDSSVKRLLNSKISKKFEEVKKWNEKKRKNFMEQCQMDFFKQYLEFLEATFPQGGRVPSEKLFRRDSKETKANLTSEFADKIGANVDRDCMSDEQEKAMDALMDKLAEEENKYYKKLFGNEFRDETNEDVVGGLKKRESFSSKNTNMLLAGKSGKKDAFTGSGVKSIDERSFRKARSRFEESLSEDDDLDSHKVNVAGKLTKYFESSQDKEDEPKFTSFRKSREAFEDTTADEPKRFSGGYLRTVEEDKSIHRGHGKVVDEFVRSSRLVRR